MQLNDTKYKNNVRTVSASNPASLVIYKDDVILECDTTAGPINLTLNGIPKDSWSTQYKLYIRDISNNASVNNITINAGNGLVPVTNVPVPQTINNASSVVINTNGGGVLIRIIDNYTYIATYNSFGTPTPPFPGVFVSRTLFVSKLGDDTTGTPERLDKPYLTIGAARSAAVATFPTRTQDNRVLIVVETGNYNESIKIEEFIDYDLNNCVIQAPDDKAASIFSDSAQVFTPTTQGVQHSIIWGNAIIRNTFPGGAAVELRGNCKVLLYCDVLYSSVYEAILLRTGYLTVYANIITSDSTNTLVQVINLATNNTFVSPILEVNNAKIFNNTAGTTNSVIEFFNGDGTPTFPYSLLPSKLTLNNCQVGNYSTNRAAIDCPNAGNNRGFADLTITNTIIWCQNAQPSISDNFVVAPPANQGYIAVYSYGVYSNQNYSLTNPLSSYNIAALVLDPLVTFNNGVTI